MSDQAIEGIVRGVPRPAPSHSASTRAEIAALLALQAHRTAADTSLVTFWNDVPVAQRWLEITQRAVTADEAVVQQSDPVQFSGPPQTLRAFAYTSIAVLDAILAAHAADARFHRPTPAQASRLIHPVPVPSGPRAGSPSEMAAASTAAAEVLAFLVPSQAASVREQAREAMTAQVAGGLSFPSDLGSGTAIGRAVAQAVIERIRTDHFNGSDAEVPTRPRGPLFYGVANPLEPLAGQAEPIFFGSADQFAKTVPPFPAPGTPEFQAQVDIFLQTMRSRTPITDAIALHHAPTPASVWLPVLTEVLNRHDLVQDQVRAAQASAFMFAGMYDTALVVWDVKYRDWIRRPFEVLGPSVPGTGQADFSTVVPTPNFPSYPSGHAAAGHAAAEILSRFFPADAQSVHDFADQDSQSRLWAGVHWDIDDTEGNILGTQIGQYIVGHFLPGGPGVG